MGMSKRIVEEMCRCFRASGCRGDPGEKEHILVFTMEEMQTSIDYFKRKKAGDKKGIRAEGLKERDDETKTKMKDISNEIKQENTVPDSWKKVMVKRSSRR